MPNKSTHKHLFEALSKKKVRESMSQNYTKIDTKTQKKEEFMGEFLTKTLNIIQNGKEQVSKWQERMKNMPPDNDENGGTVLQVKQVSALMQKSNQKKKAQQKPKPNQKQLQVVETSKLSSPI